MKRIRYCCAVSLDGCIAGPGGEFDWIVMDPEMDFAVLSGQFDTYLVGRKTFEINGGRDESVSGVRTFVFSRTLSQSDYKKVTIVNEGWKELVQSLREEPGKDIWLFGGGSLFRTLAAEGLVDTVEVGVIPTILGGGVPLVAVP
ncbi:MAG: dihydrofolate reductase family protein, partial [Gammaproteobacteria bacterium]|nr:dihydrofolate reductase family protein [Gammaproteobacteria bacterium]